MNDEEGVKERIRRRILEARDADDLARIRQQLREEGEKQGTVDAVVHELKKRGLLKFDEGKPGPSRPAMTKDVVPAMQSFIEEVYIPRPVDGRDGYWDGYEAGTRRARQDIFLAMLALRELSTMSIGQAAPLVQLAKELRPQGDTAETAKLAAQEVVQAMLPEIARLAKTQAIAASPDPMQTMLANALQPFFQQALAQFMAAFTRGQHQGMPPGPQLGPQGEPGNEPRHGSPGAASDKEFEEAWNE